MNQRRKVAFQGERGAYSEQATIQYFGPDVELLPLRTIAEVFEAVENGRTDYGIVPVENSIEGSVNETYDLMLETKLKVSGEVMLKVSHCLISHPDTKLADVTAVYSHPQALGQCRKFLKEIGCETVATYDTAGSVKMIKEKGLRRTAAIASEKAAEIYGMKILRREVEDNPYNYTRFLIISHQEPSPTGRDKTSIIFSTKHAPGMLYKALEGFAKSNINLTTIMSRPTKTTPWEYNFYVDLEGHRKDEPVEECLRQLREKTVFVKVLGSYPRAHLDR